MMSQRAASQYQQVGTQASLAEASPHRLIQMLMEGVLQRVAEAKGHLGRGDIAAKGEAIGKAVSILGGLRDSLNLDEQNSLVTNLEALYSYMQQRLIQANTQSPESEQALNEVMSLMHTVKEGWDGIADQAAG